MDNLTPDQRKKNMQHIHSDNREKDCGKRTGASFGWVFPAECAGIS